MTMTQENIAGHQVLIGRVGDDFIVVDAQVWEEHRRAGIATLQRLEPEREAEQAVLQAILAPEYWRWCLADATPGVSLLNNEYTNQQRLDLGA